MVSRTPKPMMTRKSALDLKNRRPKRNISPKNLDDSVSGLSWREERELKKALYASLQEARRQQKDDKPEEDDSIATCSRDGLSQSQSRASLCSTTPSDCTRYLDESSVDSGISFSDKKDTPQTEAKKKKIHAQRKFAQGSTPSTPVETPSKPKLKVSPVKLFPGRPTTEDFLTYLCFRGTSVLPPHLDLMNVNKEETDSDMAAANGRPGFTRESSPASSSSASHQNEDSMDVPDGSVKLQTPSRKAARASASTPQTARGFANLRQGGRRSDSKMSPGSRKRLADSYSLSGKLKSKSVLKGHLGDRLSLKRKAMATLTAAKRMSPEKQNKIRKLRGSVSDGELVKKQGKLKLKIPPHGKTYDTETGHRPAENRKRKSTGDISALASPSKKSKLQGIGKVRPGLKCRSKEIGKAKSKKAYLCNLEAHPKKLYDTLVKTKKTFKPHRPVTRATTHLKQVLKAAKKAASKRMNFVDRVLPKKYRLVGDVGTKKKVSMPETKKKISLHSSGSRSSVTSYGSDNSGEIRIKTERFPESDDPSAMVQCPTYYPSDEQFRDPILYIQSIQSEAEQYGMCKIVPPCSWKMESRELEDLRFTTQIQYIHKMWKKWSPITEQLEYIKKLHNDAGNEEFQVPQIGGVELDLVKLYELVQKYGGMKGTAGKEKKWLKIAEAMKIPKQADRVSKLYAAYCKYLLAYETLSDEETEKLQEKVQQDRKKEEGDRPSNVPQCHKCVYKGKSQPLSSFHRAARNTQLLYDPEDCNTAEQIEEDYWEIVRKSDDHVSVQGASLDTSIYGSMFPVRRDNPYSRHGWNLHNFVESKGSILHHLGLIAGVTVPTLHIGMLYTTKCWSCNGHNLPTVQYLHQGPGLIWYAIPSQEADKLRRALKKVAPKSVRDEGFCLQPDSLMVPPSVLVEKGVSLSRCVQSEREFIVIFPSAYYSSISLGYTLSESVHYGTQDWIPEGYQASKSLEVNHDVELFSMDAMLVFLARDISTPDTTLALLLPYLEKVVDREIVERRKLMEAGLKETERLHDKLEKPSPRCEVLEEIVICDVSNKICYLSMVLNSHENSAFSLEQGLLHIQKKKNLKHCKLMYRYSEDELKVLVKEVKSRLRGGNSTPPSAASPMKRKTRKSVGDRKSSPASSTSSK